MTAKTEPRDWSRFVALGDSFTEGLTDHLGEDGRYVGWADRTAMALGERAEQRGAWFQYANLAIRGRLTADVVREQVPMAVQLGPDLASLGVGVNDTLRRSFDLDRTASALETGVRQLRGAGSDVLLFGFGDPGRRSRVMSVIRERIRLLNTAVDAIADRYGCFVVHFWDVAAMDDDRLWDADRLHLSPLGHDLAAQCALEALGVGDAGWRTPLIPEPAPGVVARRRDDLAWTRHHLAPWLVRRARGQSSGDDITPKRPTWTDVRTLRSPQS